VDCFIDHRCSITDRIVTKVSEDCLCRADAAIVLTCHQSNHDPLLLLLSTSRSPLPLLIGCNDTAEDHSSPEHVHIPLHIQYIVFSDYQLHPFPHHPILNIRMDQVPSDSTVAPYYPQSVRQPTIDQVAQM
jgi:hypothetical protein